MRFVEMVNDAGEGVCNEDRAGQAGTLAWVIDGATSLTDAPALPARTDAEWLADHVDRYLRAHAGRDTADLPALYRRLAADVAVALADLEFPADLLPPACSCGVAWQAGDVLLMGIVGDAFLYVPGTDTLLSDPLFGRREAAGVAGTATPARDRLVAGRAGIAVRRRQYISGTAGSFVLSNNPAVAGGVRQASVPVRPGQRVLLCTDGFARLVEPYGIYPSWAALAAAVEAGGLAAALRRLREYESAAEPSTTHYKHRDDACALVVEL
jgi:protein phosphatase 2C-like protein